MEVNLYELKKNKTDFISETIVSSRDANKFIRQFYSDDIGIYESFFMMMLNNAGKCIGYAKISQGGIVGTVVDIRIIAKYAIDSLATRIILAHNHPSGNLQPSIQDKNVTSKVKDALNLFDIIVTDHIILAEGDDNFYSFADNCLL